MKPRQLILLLVALIVFSVYGYKAYRFNQDLKKQRQEYSMDFLDKLEIYDAPEAEWQVETKNAFQNEDFEKLEHLAAKYLSHHNRWEEGRWFIESYFWLIAEKGDEDERRDKLKTIRKWREARPNSTVAKVAHAKTLINYAWDARGSGYSKTLKREQVELFVKRLTEAAEILKTLSEEELKECPEGLSDILVCSMGLGISRANFNKLYLECAKLAPLSTNLHYTAAHFSTRQWGGKPGEWEANLKKAIEPLPDEKADQVYATTIYKMVARGHFFGRVYNEVFKPAKIDPDRVVRGLKLVIENTPEDSYYEIRYKNALAHAYMEYANDPQACKATLESANWQVDTSIWSTEKTFDGSCREWLVLRYEAYNNDIDEHERLNSPLRFFKSDD